MDMNFKRQIAIFLGLALAGGLAATAKDYTVVVSPETQAKPEWAAVSAALKKKHDAEVLTSSDWGVCKAALQHNHPRYVCFVARPEEVDAEYVRQVHILSRLTGDGMSGDFLWGIVTGPTAKDALRIAQAAEPLVAKCALNTTVIEDFDLESSMTLSDATRQHWELKSMKSMGDTVETSYYATNGWPAWSLCLTNGNGTFMHQWLAASKETNAGIVYTNWVKHRRTAKIENGKAELTWETLTSPPVPSITSVVSNGLMQVGVKDGTSGRLERWSVKLGDGKSHALREELAQGRCTNMASIFADFYNNHDVDVLVTAGHGSPFNMELPFKAGSLVSGGGKLGVMSDPDFRQWLQQAGKGNYGKEWYLAPNCDEARRRWMDGTNYVALKASPHPKVVLAAGNCLVGDAERHVDSIAMTWLGPGGANQLVGYTGTPKHGVGGWGTLKLWNLPTGVNTLSESFYMANVRAEEELKMMSPELLTLANETNLKDSGRGMRLASALSRIPKDQCKHAEELLQDLDMTVLYGDPAWEAWLGEARRDAGVSWNRVKGGWQLTVRVDTNARLMDAWKLGINRVYLLPERINNPEVRLEEGGKTAWVSENTVALAMGQMAQMDKSCTVTITSKKPTDESTGGVKQN
jgi:hypothetical protein